MGRMKHVIILLNDSTIEVNPKRVTVGRKAQEEVCWHAPQYGAVVCFKPKTGSPFSAEEYFIPKGGSVATGPPVEQSRTGSYEYSVSIKPSSGPPITIDPEVFIED